MSLVFSLKNIEKVYGDDTLFRDLTIDFKPGEQLGLIGVNGSGKSTLLKIIARSVEPDAGELAVPSNVRCIYLSQEDTFPPQSTVEGVLFDAVKTIVFDPKDQHRIVQKALGKGHFSEPAATVETLSGGWKKKLAITRALCAQPDMLLLDEPTNHLDINGILWLENQLNTARFSFIIVSHDRAFLENTCRNIIEIGRHFPEGYLKTAGPYTRFLTERTRFLQAQEKQQASLSSKMRREEEWLRQGPKARTSKAKYRIDQASDLKKQLHAVQLRNKNAARVDIDFSSTGRKTKKLLRAYNLGKTMGGNLLFSNLTFELGPGFCLGVTGENGSGKSTFLSILEKRTMPDQGKIEWAPDLKVSVYDQDRSKLDPESTLRDALNPAGGDSVHYKGRPVHVVTWAKRFLFMPDQLDMPAKRLSGGEKARILIANLMLTPCDILFLDEPTNDLDILSLEVLEDSIRQFPGAVVIVSHDRYLMDNVCHKILFLDPGHEPAFFQDFNQILKHRTKTAKRSGPAVSKKVKEKKSGNILFSFKEKYELDHIEDNILDAEERVEALSTLVQQPEILSDALKMKKHCLELKQAQEKVQMLYDRWEILEQKKTAAQK